MAPPVKATFPDALDPTFRFLALLKAHQAKQPPPPYPLQGGQLAGVFNRLGYHEWSRPLQKKLIHRFIAPTDDDLLGVRTQSLTGWAGEYFSGGLTVLGPPVPGLLMDLCRMDASLLPHSFGARVWTGEKMSLDDAWRTGLEWADKILNRDSGFLVGIHPDPVEGDLWLDNHLPIRLVFNSLPYRYNDLIRQRAKEKAPVLLVASLCDFKQFRVAPQVQMQVGGIGAVSDGEYLFGSKRLEEATKKFQGAAKKGFVPQAVPGSAAQTGAELVYGAPPGYASQAQAVLEETKTPHLVVHLRHPDQWMDANLAVAARAHAVAGADLETLVITSGFVLPPTAMVSPGVAAVNLLRLNTQSLHRLSVQLARWKLRFNRILLAVPPVLGGINLQPSLEKWLSALNAFGEVTVLGQHRKTFPQDLAFYSRLNAVNAAMAAGRLKQGLPLGYREYMGLLRDVASGWAKEDTP